MKYERPVSSISLVGGFIFSIFTLTRVDVLFENIIVIAHVLIAISAILFLSIYEEKRGEKSRGALHFWMVCAIQFAFGGLLSTYLVFYFRSGTFSASWPFLLVLAIVFIFNERLRHHYSRLVFQTGVLFISIYSFAIFIVPVILHKIGPEIFILSGFISLGAIAFFILCLWFISRERFKQSRKLLRIHTIIKSASS